MADRATLLHSGFSTPSEESGLSLFLVPLILRGQRRQVLQELEKSCIDLRRTLLLGPVTTSWEQMGALQIGYERAQVGDQILTARQVDGQVALTSDIEGRGAHQGSRPCCHQFPALLNRPIPVESTAEARSLKFAGIVVNILLCQPGGQCLRVEHDVQEASSLWHNWLWRSSASRGI